MRRILDRKRILDASRRVPLGQVFADIHCHCLPGFDDGPSDRAQALALCRTLVADRITTVVATPHQFGRFDGLYEGQAIRAAVVSFNALLAEVHLPLTVLPGADVRIDERIAEFVQAGRVLTVGDAGRYLMLELPHEVFIDPEPLLMRLAESELRVIISHPERHGFLARQPLYVEKWADYSPCLQITAASFLGSFGPEAQAAAWAFLDGPLPALVATDAHNTGSRAPRMLAAYARLSARLGCSAARLLCEENPRRLLAGDELWVLREECVRRGAGI